MLGQILLTATNAVVPIVLLLALGYILKQRGFLNEVFAETGNKLVFRICLPAMLFVSVYDIQDVTKAPWDAVIYSIVAVMLLFVIGVVVAVVTTPVAQRRGVIVQCVFRSNFAIIGLPLSQILGGEEALQFTAILLAFTVPAFNLLAVVALSMFRTEGGKKVPFGKVLRDIVTNPLLVAAALGFVCQALRLLQISAFGQPVFLLSRDLTFFYTTLEFLKNVTTPLALLVMGARFTFTAVGELKKEILVSTVFRLIVAPAIGVGLGWVLSTYTPLLNLQSIQYPAMIAQFGTPVAVSSAIMAAGMHNDTQLATQLVVWTSVFSMVTLFLWICVLMAFGLMPV